MSSIVKQCCRVCGRSVDERSRRSLFTYAGRRDKLPDRLSALTGVPIDQDDLSEFVCRKCASELDRYARKVAEAEDLKRNLVDKLSATTLRHRSVLKWAGKKAPHADSSDSPGFRILHHKRSKPEGSPRTPASAQKPPAKHPRSSVSASVTKSLYSPGPMEVADEVSLHKCEPCVQTLVDLVLHIYTYF